ncbi:MAG: hypothetical protein HETSPECPRED_007938 [Heterodermia speciosa]|uniref:Glycosyltransferase family 2 protein n=1 Tax=Heterodermia speciosa TaxID=116794 RepID=A0A8H3EJX6_9LECA|nr:MAG: hypothetical protein HETSPECPRED_007938 [Heterodermia speciosa]
MDYLLAFVCLWLWRYTRLIVNVISSWTFKPIALSTTPSYSTDDITVVIATLGTSEDFRRCLLSVVACLPSSIIIVTPNPRVQHVRKICDGLKILSKVNILGANKANKRLQMIQGLKEVRTSITVFADDDVFWPTTFLAYLLAAFEDPKVGAAGTFTKPERPSNPNLWDFLGACYLERWNFEIAATSHIDGGISCLSGRTSAIRTSIVQTQKFIDDFNGEKWLGRINLLAADDENFITRFLVNHGWRIAIQGAPEAALTTTLESDSKFLGQCIRWYRTTWRSNFTSLFIDRVIWREQPWSSYALHISSFNPPALVVDGALSYFLHHALEAAQPNPYGFSTMMGLVIFAVWLLFTKTVKLWPYFCEHPEDLTMLPAQIVFGYVHGLIKLYTLLTLHKTTWGGGKASLVAAYTKATGAAFMSSGFKALESSGLKRVGNSTTDLHRLGEKSDA